MTDSPEIAAMRAALEMQRDLLKQAVELARPQSLSERLGELRELAVTIREISAPATPPAPAPAPADGPGRLVDRIADLLDRMIQASDRNAGARAGRPGPAAPPRPPLPAWLASFAPAVPYIVGLAASGAPPGDAATAIVAQLAPIQRERLQPVMRAPGYPGSVIAAVPDFAPYADWLTLFLYELRGQLSSDGAGGGAELPDAETLET